jgi:hypothetical protein
MARDGTSAGEASGEPHAEIRALLASSEPSDLRKGLALLEVEIARSGALESRPLFEMLASVFYLDPLDRPELVPILDEAVSLVVGFGDWVIPVLLDHLEAGDVKAQLAVGHALGRIGADAVGPLLAKYDSLADPSVRPFVLYALGKIDSPTVVKALGVMLEAIVSPDLETRDTAARALGRMADSIPGGRMPEDLRSAVVERLHATLADTNAGIRAKAVRSLGKMAARGHMTSEERDTLAGACRRLLGQDGSFEWDRAFVVRKEAETALRAAEGVSYNPAP